MSEFNWLSYLMRWVASILLVLATYNPFGMSYWDWLLSDGEPHQESPDPPGSAARQALADLRRGGLRHLQPERPFLLSLGARRRRLGSAAAGGRHLPPGGDRRPGPDGVPVDRLSRHRR